LERDDKLDGIPFERFWHKPKNVAAKLKCDVNKHCCVDRERHINPAMSKSNWAFTVANVEPDVGKPDHNCHE
jgi:hypothetical protein